MEYMKHFRIIHEPQKQLRSIPHKMSVDHVDAENRIQAGENFIKNNPGRRIVAIKEE